MGIKLVNALFIYLFFLSGLLLYNYGRQRNSDNHFTVFPLLSLAMPPRNPKSEKILDFVVNKGNGIKGLVDTGIETVPDLYILPIEERLLPNNILTYDSIPVIDVSNWDDPKVKESIRDAAGKWGFFQIINHGVPLHVLDAVKEAAHRFFGLPYEERNKYWAGNSLTDTVTLKTSFVPQAEAALEWKDYLSFRCSPRDLESFPLWPPVCSS
ncbi:hypothetical protein V6Z11_A09G130100 [Gossypium hirsutum]